MWYDLLRRLHGLFHRHSPIVSYHFGAQNHSELQSLLRKSLKMVAIFGVVMVLASQALARLWPPFSWAMTQS